MSSTRVIPHFGMDGVDEDEAFEMYEGDTIVERLRRISEGGDFTEFDIDLVDAEPPVTLRCHGYAIVERYGLMRLYIAYCHVGDGDENMYTAYIAENVDGKVLLVPEHDESMMRAVRGAMNAAYGSDKNSDEVAATAEPTQKGSTAGKVLKVIGCIILLPVWLLWQFVKALLSLFNIGFGDSSTVRAFKRGYSGTDNRKAYTFTNDMGCEETLYTDDGVTFYREDGSYAGTSDDGINLHK